MSIIFYAALKRIAHGVRFAQTEFCILFKGRMRCLVVSAIRAFFSTYRRNALSFLDSFTFSLKLLNNFLFDRKEELPQSQSATEAADERGTSSCCRRFFNDCTDNSARWKRVLNALFNGHRETFLQRKDIPPWRWRRPEEAKKETTAEASFLYPAGEDNLVFLLENSP